MFKSRNKLFQINKYINNIIILNNKFCTKLPGRPEFMIEKDNEEIELLGLHDNELKKTIKSDSRIWNPEWKKDEGELDWDKIDKIEKDKKNSKQEHRLITSKLKQDIIIEIEETSIYERFYSFLLLGISFYIGRLCVRQYYMWTVDFEELRQQKILQLQQSNS